MEFTREAWENAPEGAVVERDCVNGWEPVSLIGFASGGRPVIESRSGCVAIEKTTFLRIILPKRKVTVQLWQSPKAKSLATKILGVDTWDAAYNNWTLLGEHTFEIEEE